MQLPEYGAWSNLPRGVRRLMAAIVISLNEPDTSLMEKVTTIDDHDGLGRPCSCRGGREGGLMIGRLGVALLERLSQHQRTIGEEKARRAEEKELLCDVYYVSPQTRQIHNKGTHPNPNPNPSPKS